MTPENKVKRGVRKILEGYEGLWFAMPVPGGYGRSTLDFLCCYRGRFFAIETKADGKKPTLRQEDEIAWMESSMAKVFVIIGERSPVVDELVNWLNKLGETIPNDPNISPGKVRRRPI